MRFSLPNTARGGVSSLHRSLVVWLEQRYERCRHVLEEKTGLPRLDTKNKNKARDGKK